MVEVVVYHRKACSFIVDKKILEIIDPRLKLQYDIEVKSLEFKTSK